MPKLYYLRKRIIQVEIKIVNIMFSGIVEEFATVRKLVREQGNLHLTLTCSFVSELKIDQSVAHNGVCLTVVDITGDEYTGGSYKIELI